MSFYCVGADHFELEGQKNFIFWNRSCSCINVDHYYFASFTLSSSFQPFASPMASWNVLGKSFPLWSFSSENLPVDAC